MSIIRDGYKIPIISTPLPQHFKNNVSAFKESDFVFDAILELLSDNRIKEIFSYTPDILNPLTVSIQSSSKKRFILDLLYATSICMFSNRSLSAKAFIPSGMLFHRVISFSLLI